MTIRYNKTSEKARKLWQSMSPEDWGIKSGKPVRLTQGRRTSSPTPEEPSTDNGSTRLTNIVSITGSGIRDSETDVLPSAELLPGSSDTWEIVRCQLTFVRKADTWEVSAYGDEQALQLLLQYCRDRVGRERGGDAAD